MRSGAAPTGHDGQVHARLVEVRHGDHVISTDPARIDLDVVHSYISEDSYWAAGRSLEVQRRANAHSALLVGAYGPDDAQVGFARMVTDLATFAWLADVFVLPVARGLGLGTELVRVIVEHPDVVGIDRQILATGDAHGLYAKFGYTPVPRPERIMVRAAN